MAIISKENSPRPSANAGVDNGEYNFPIGWRFKPTDQELIESYLSRKVAFTSFPAKVIKEIDADEFYKYHPKYLVENVCFKIERMLHSLKVEWYLFINQDDYFHARIHKMKQVGQGNVGFWRSDGKEEAIYDGNQKVLAYKIHSTFYSSKFKKTNWTMELYRMPYNHENSRRDHEWVVARIRGAQSLN